MLEVDQWQVKSHKTFQMLNCAMYLSFHSFQSNIVFEPHRDKTKKMACAPSEDSDQPWHSPSLIRVFAVHLKKARSLSYPLSAQRTLIRLGGCPG